MRPNADTKQCRYGQLSFFPDDEYVGRSLALYGEYSEEEVGILAQILRPGDIVVEIGSNIGSLTVPMAQMIGETGKLYAFEPHPNNVRLLDVNVTINGLKGKVEIYNTAATDHNGTAMMPSFEQLGHKNYGRIELGKGDIEVHCGKIDALGLEKLRLLKLDCEGHELPAILGAVETIKRCRPIIYTENDRPEHLQALIDELTDLGYRMWWHRPPLWNPKNFTNHKHNVFGEIVSLNMLCVPEERGTAFVDGLDEVADLTVCDDMYDKQIVRYTRIVEKNPKDLQARLMLAHFHALMQHADEAAELIAENLRRNPHDKATRHVQAMHLLQQGKWKEGWEAYELRYEQKTTQPFGYRPHNGEKWDGQPTDEPLLVWCEQGFGDMLMLGPRLWPRVKALAPNAFMEIHPPLYELFEIAGIKPLYRLGRTLPEYTKHISVPSLCFALKCFSEDDFRSPPYLFADPLMTKKWQDRNLPRIGICCKGSPISERPHTRDIDHNLFRPLTTKYGPFMTLEQVGQFPSYADTAACLSALDLLITVDTSVAHLAGALGVETWLLLSFDPDFRWGLKGDKTFWYDKMRIFRQPKFRDWESVVHEVEAAFEQRMETVNGHS